MTLYSATNSSDSWSMSLLEDLSDKIDYGVTASANAAPVGPKFLRITDIQDGRVEWRNVPYCKASAKEQIQCELQRGDIVFARTGATTGKSYLISDCPLGAVFASYLIRVRPSHELIYPKFLAYFFQTQAYWNQISEKSDGSTQPGVNSSKLAELKVPFPPLAEQQRIAALLEKADRLRQTRRYAQTLSDTFLQSVFLQMFGDPVTNPMGWDVVTLGDIIVSAKDGPHVSPKYVDYGIPFLSTRNIKPGQVLWNDLKYVSAEDASEFWKKCKPRRGDILYTKGGTTGMAKAVDFDHEIAVWVHIAVLKLKMEQVNSVWLENALNSDFCYKQSQDLTFGIVNRDLGLQRMPGIKMYLPPLKKQEAFARVVRRYERLRAMQAEATRQAEHLFQSLLAQAFG